MCVGRFPKQQAGKGRQLKNWAEKSQLVVVGEVRDLVHVDVSDAHESVVHIDAGAVGAVGEAAAAVGAPSAFEKPGDEAPDAAERNIEARS